MLGQFRPRLQAGVPIALSALTASVAAALLIVSSVDAGDRGGGDTRTTGPSISSTANDFFQPGTQPHSDVAPLTPILDANVCAACHGNYDPSMEIEPHRTWATSMMAMSARDPMFWACLTVAVQDAPGAENFCVRCHVPSRFLSGSDMPAAPTDLTLTELQGVNCSFCHRLVDLEYEAGVNPIEDESILEALATDGVLPPEATNARYIVAPTDQRRGPFDDVNEFTHNPAPTLTSPFHQESEFCWNCHDVSNPLMLKQPDGTYQMTALDEAHPTHAQDDMLPLHRTYSEWKNSYYFTVGGIQHNGRFGGNDEVHGGFMEVCQDCHMPDFQGFGCSVAPPERPNIPQHSFLGANTWVQRAVHSMYPESETFLTDALVDTAVARNIDFLEKASDLALSKVGSSLKVRIVNRTGHKLPTGFPDGRRMWINVKFLAYDDTPVGEHGGYDFEEAILEAGSTKVYEMKLGIDATQAAVTGLPEGETFHFMLGNKIIKDNRIPPIGFEPGIAAINGTKPVGASYASGQHWDDTFFVIPPGAARAVVTVYYQVTSKEFVEFLRDENRTDSHGQIAYDKWVEFGKSAPVAIDASEIIVGNLCPTDMVDGDSFLPPPDGTVDGADLAFLLGAWGSNPGSPADFVDSESFLPPPDELVDGADLAVLLGAWGDCPQEE